MYLSRVSLGGPSDGLGSSVAAITAKNEMRGVYVSVDNPCTLEDFEAISLFIESNNAKGSLVSPFFCPEFAMTQCPSMSTGSMTILFPSFHSLCRNICFESIEDRGRIMWKEKVRNRDDTYAGSTTMKNECANGYIRSGNEKVTEVAMMRVLGSLVGNEYGSEASIACIGRTAGFHVVSPGHGFGPQELTLFRESDKFHVVDQKFEYPLRKHFGDPQCLLGRLRESSCWAIAVCDGRTLEEPQSMDNLRKQAFFLQWSPSKMPSVRFWSKHLSNPRKIIGRLELSMPIVLIGGSVLCEEVSKIPSVSDIDKLLRS